MASLVWLTVLLPVSGLMENTIWADDAFMAISFLARMAKMTGDMSYINDAANQVIKYHKYLWCPGKTDSLSLLSYGYGRARCCSLESCQRLGFHGNCRFACSDAAESSYAS